MRAFLWHNKGTFPKEGAFMERLTDLPNIGPKLAEDLEKIGVTDPDRFRELGAEEAFMRIRAQADPAADRKSVV